MAVHCIFFGYRPEIQCIHIYEFSVYVLFIYPCIVQYIYTFMVSSRYTVQFIPCTAFLKPKADRCHLGSTSPRVTPG